MSGKTYIMGNPPFFGARLQNAEQKANTEQVWNNIKGVGELDFVSNWYKIAAENVAEHGGRVALVSTNSIAQGVQPAIMWTELYEMGMRIDFAHQTFKWSNDAAGVAAVHVVIVGFSKGTQKGKRKLWQYADIKGAPSLREVDNINAYLVDAPDVLVRTRTSPLSPSTPKLLYGSQPNDGGFLSDISTGEAVEIRASDPTAAKYLRRIIGARELIHDVERWCLWLVDADPNDMRTSKVISERVAGVKAQRAASTRPATRELAKTAHLFGFVSQPSTPYIAVPLHSSEDRDYVPMAYLEPDVVANNALSIVPDAPVWLFGILQSRPFNVWNKAVSGRLESRVRISNTITYNNFPFPDMTEQLKTRVIAAAKSVLDARAKYPNSSLADLYESTSMPTELSKAHTKLDTDVLTAYGLKSSASDAEILEVLFEMYANQLATQSKEK